MRGELPGDSEGAERVLAYLKEKQISIEEVNADELAGTIVHDR